MKKMIHKIILASMFILLGSYSFVNAQTEIQYVEDFEDGAASWELEPGWELIQENGNTVLQGEGHVWARHDMFFPGDFHLHFRARIIQGNLHLVTHLNNQGRYYTGIGSWETSLSKQYWPDTFQGNLARKQISLPQNTWIEVEMLSEGDSIKLWINGQEHWTYADPEKFEGGRIAFETLENSLVQVDDITLTYLGEPTEEAPPSEGEGVQALCNVGGTKEER